ncbi:MAG: hypothetical protein QOG20_3313 [Pseudonocardiales bacterium]|jgi:hypothetical protein|nr:hypothetical protein [Pseudonocardiales bacterium]
MRGWLASVPDDDLVSVIEVVPALQRALARDGHGAGRTERHALPGVRARIREFSDQQVEGLARAFLAGVVQRLRTDGVGDEEIDEPDAGQLRSMLGRLPPAHGRLALHALLIGSGPASSTARMHATELLTALHGADPKEHAITATTHETSPHDTVWDWSTVATVVERLRHDVTDLSPALRAAADAVQAGTLPVDAEPTAASLARFAAEMAELAKRLGPLLGDEPVPSDLDGVQVHLDRVAEEQRLAAERAVVREHRDGIRATVAQLEADGGPAFLVQRYRALLAEIERELGEPAPTATPASLVTLPQTVPEARALLAGIGVDDGLLAVLRPWPELCEPGEYIRRADVTAVVAAEPSAVPDLLRRLDLLGVLRENESGELALDEVTLRCLALLPAE